MARLASQSRRLYRRALRAIPGGVNSPVRYYPPYPMFVAEAKGSKFRTVDGEEYLDYCMAYGALIDGHASREVVEAVQNVVETGSIFGSYLNGALATNYGYNDRSELTSAQSYAGTNPADASNPVPARGFNGQDVVDAVVPAVGVEHFCHGRGRARRVGPARSAKPACSAPDPTKGRRGRAQRRRRARRARADRRGARRA